MKKVFTMFAALLMAVSAMSEDFYLKGDWGVSGWSWGKMIAGEDNTYTYQDVYGGKGVNINTELKDEGSSWIEGKDIDGDEMQEGDEILLTYDATEKKLSAKVLVAASSVTPLYYIKSAWNCEESWTWRIMSANTEGTELTYEGVFGGTGINIKASGAAEVSWFEAKDIKGDEIKAGDKVLFTYNVAEKSVTAKVITVYYIKSQWAEEGEWKWKEMTPNADKSEWTYTSDFYGSGCNVNIAAKDQDAAWFANDGSIGGDEIAEGDNVTFTYNVAAATLTAKKNSPTALENAVVEGKAVKVVENGQIVIIRDGVRYNAQGSKF